MMAEGRKEERKDAYERFRGASLAAAAAAAGA